MLGKRASSRRLLKAQVKDGSAEEPEIDWVCFCCTKKNSVAVDLCCVCGRSKTYVAKREILPLHGAGGLHFRKSQIRTIIRDDADLVETDDKQWNALHYVSAIGNKDLLQELIDFGGSVTATTEHGHTPLHLAVESGVLSSVALCVQSGANINAATFFERHTPLHMAVQDGKKAIAFYLIDVGADVNCKNAVGRTPLHLSAVLGRNDLAHALITHGADVDVMDTHGWTARQIAEYNGHRDFEEYMVRTKLTVCQSVIKELPPADWHSSIWSQVVVQYDNKKQELIKQRALEAKVEDEQKKKMPAVNDLDSVSSGSDSMTATLKEMLMAPQKNITLKLISTSSRPPSIIHKPIAAANVLNGASCLTSSSTRQRVPVTNVCFAPSVDSETASVLSGLTFNGSQV